MGGPFDFLRAGEAPLGSAHSRAGAISSGAVSGPRDLVSQPRASINVVLRSAIRLGRIRPGRRHGAGRAGDRKSTRLNSSHGYSSYAVVCLKKKKKNAEDTLNQS